MSVIIIGLVDCLVMLVIGFVFGATWKEEHSVN